MKHDVLVSDRQNTEQLAEQIKEKSCILVSKHETWHDCSQWSTLPKKLLGHSKNPRWPPFFKMAATDGKIYHFVN